MKHTFTCVTQSWQGQGLSGANVTVQFQPDGFAGNMSLALTREEAAKYIIGDKYEVVLTPVSGGSNAAQ